jgi:hypothetical protein
MTDPTLDRTFTAWLEERAQPHAPTGLAADIVERTARTRPRPAWRIPERWFSMPTTIRLALIPRDLLLILALWLILALTVAGAAIGGRITFTRAVLPAPVSGPAANGLIAFERDSDIWVVEPDGSGERPLIASPGIQLAPSWSRDGTRIAYWSAETDAGPWDLVVEDGDGTGAVTVASGVVDLGSTFGLDWAPDGGTIVYSVRTIPWGADGPCLGETGSGDYCSSRIFTAATDGTTGGVAIGDPELDARNPVWSPDGSLIAFGGGDGRTSKDHRLYLMAADGRDMRTVGSASGNDWSFGCSSWSPDGTSIATLVGRSSMAVILVAVDGTGETMVTETPSYELCPGFAADGSLGWHGVGDDPCCLQVLDADGARLSLPGSMPLWSPDSALVVTSPAVEAATPSLLVVDRAGAILATIPDAAGAAWQRLAPEVRHGPVLQCDRDTPSV